MDLSSVALENLRAIAVPQIPEVTVKARPGDIAKRVFDVIVAASALILLSPLFVVVTLVLKLTSRGPAVFVHNRLGKHGATFGCLKFRSMVVNSQEVLARHLETDAEARAEWARDHKLRNDPRITRVGRFLRKSSLDELPQLINVLRGEMSLVGPRPIVQDEVVKYGRYIVDYASVAPGITGLWQVSGRNNVSYRRRVALDSAYARNRTMRGDIMIMLRTVKVIIFGDGCY